MTEQSNHTIGPADYAEPRCPLSGETYASAPASIPVPQRRIIEKMDEYMSRRDYAGAERHLLYWLEEAKLGADARGELMIRGELIGHFRKTGNREAALREVDAALALLKRMDFENSISAGTTYVNSATRSASTSGPSLSSKMPAGSTNPPPEPRRSCSADCITIWRWIWPRSEGTRKRSGSMISRWRRCWACRAAASRRRLRA